MHSLYAGSSSSIARTERPSRGEGRGGKSLKNHRARARRTSHVSRGRVSARSPFSAHERARDVHAARHRLPTARATGATPRIEAAGNRLGIGRALKGASLLLVADTNKRERIGAVSRPSHSPRREPDRARSGRGVIIEHRPAHPSPLPVVIRRDPWVWSHRRGDGPRSLRAERAGVSRLPPARCRRERDAPSTLRHEEEERSALGSLLSPSIPIYARARIAVSGVLSVAGCCETVRRGRAGPPER